MNARRLRTFVHHQLREATDAFAYFALSIVWSAAVAKWSLPDGGLTTPIEPGTFEEPVGALSHGRNGNASRYYP